MSDHEGGTGMTTPRTMRRFRIVFDVLVDGENAEEAVEDAREVIKDGGYEPTVHEYEDQQSENGGE